MSFICRTESLQQTNSVYVTKLCKKKHTKKHTQKIKLPKNSQKVPKRAPKCQKKVEHCWHFWQLFGNIYKFYLLQWLSATTIFCLFVAMIQWDELNFCLLQWLSATKQNLIFFFIFLLHVTKELGKKKNLPNLNFTSAIKLLWGTFNAMFNKFFWWIGIRSFRYLSLSTWYLNVIKCYKAIETYPTGRQICPSKIR